MQEQTMKVSTLRVNDPPYSTYIDTVPSCGVSPADVHSWFDFTVERLEWIYRGQDRSAAQAADLKAWRELGR